MSIELNNGLLSHAEIISLVDKGFQAAARQMIMRHLPINPEQHITLPQNPAVKIFFFNGEKLKEALAAKRCNRKGLAGNAVIIRQQLINAVEELQEKLYEKGSN